MMVAQMTSLYRLRDKMMDIGGRHTTLNKMVNTLQPTKMQHRYNKIQIM